MNPVAVELAEVSLWLNAIYGEADGQGRPLPARVPWFGYQLFAGNSLIGARAQVFPPGKLLKGAKPAWHEEPPRPVTRAQPRKADEIWHFLLPDPGMADYADKDAKKLYPDDFERLKKWRKGFNAPLAHHEVVRLQQLSTKVQELWDEHTKALVRDRARTEDPIDVWPHRKASRDAAVNAEQVVVSRAQKEAIRRQGLLNEDGDLATPFRRLKLVMDYWCALWFWPITQSNTLPSREAWWMEVGAILEGNVVDIAQQPGLDLQPTEPQALQVIVPEVQPSFEGFETQLPLSQVAEQPNLHDKFGQLRISRLREHFPRVLVVETLASSRRFMHWELCFADVLLQRGGFDLILGNPPWLKVEWNEAGVLGERNPIFAVRKISASELVKLRSDAFSRFGGLKQSWTEELQEAEGTQRFLNATQNYSVLAGVQSNLYKCFLPLSWRLLARLGVAAILHPEGPYDDPKGGSLRQSMYSRLRAHFQFQNEFGLFPIGHQFKFGINVYGASTDLPHFDNISNLFSPITVDLCYQHDGAGLPGGIKTDAGEWNTIGHAARIVATELEVLNVYAKLFDLNGTPGIRARLPALHSSAFNSVLKKMAAYPSRWSDIGERIYLSEMWDETGAQKDGTVYRRAISDSGFIKDPNEWVLSGPHIYVANPFSKTPRNICTEKGHYDSIDLEGMQEDFLPRTNYRPMDDRIEYLRRTPRVGWEGANEAFRTPVTDHYRLAFRAMIASSLERTLVGALVPPGCAHIHGIQSNVFKNTDELVAAGCCTASVVADWFIKSLGRSNLHATWQQFPRLPACQRMICRYLTLNCLTAHFAPLWEALFDIDFVRPRVESARQRSIAAGVLAESLGYMDAKLCAEN